MPRAPRREFLKSVVAAATVAGLPRPVSAGEPADPPLRQGLQVPGIHGYPGEPSVRAGEEAEFFISADTAFELSIVRLGPAGQPSDSDPVIARLGEFPARQQPVHPGSYVHVARRIRGRKRQLSLTAWVRPWNLERLQGVITQEDKQDDRGFALGVGPQGYVGFFLGDGATPDSGTIHRTPPGVLTAGRWHHLAAVWDGRLKTIWVDGRPYGPWSYESFLDPGPHPLRLGAMGEWGATLRHLDGDLAGPAVYGRSLSAEEVRGEHAAQALRPPHPRGLLGFWPLDEEKGEEARDRSEGRRHGRILNLGTWMIGGPAFDGAAPRYGAYDPAADMRRGHGLRLAADDLYDCEWSRTVAWRVPTGAAPGLYVARPKPAPGGRAADISFIVRRARRRAPAKLLVLASTNTWRAYNAAPFGQWPQGGTPVIGTDGLPNPPAHPPAYSFYRNHAAGQGTFQLGWRIPCPVADPSVRYGGPSDYSHLLRAERYALGWLERSGYRFDLAADRDLDQDPQLLAGVDCLVLNGHSEYWSQPMLTALDHWLKAGGSLLVLSGNSLFWRVSFRRGGRVMECRKVDAPGFQIPPERRGEAWHSDDGMRGGMLRECGRPGWRLVGLDSLGWNQHPDPAAFGAYRVTDSSHPLFHQPEETGLKNGDPLGVAGHGGPSLANGHEIDVRLRTLAELSQAAPPAGARTPIEPAGIASLAIGDLGWDRGGAAFDYFFRPMQAGRRGADMIYWERPEGGRVFNAGSIGSGWALAHDPRLQALVRNVLATFGVFPRA